MRDRRTMLGLVGVVVALAVVLAVIAGRDGDGGALDPDGTGPSGLRALVRLVGSVGADVDEQVAPDADTTVVAVFRDRLSESQRDQLRSWVIDGGTLVVTDPSSPLVPRLAVPRFDLDALRPDQGECAVAALAAIEVIETASARRYELAEGSRGCFGDESSAWLVVSDQGEGTVVAAGDAGPFVNSQLDEADNAALAFALLAPRDDARIVVAEAEVGAGDRELLDLVTDPVWLAVVQLGVAFVVYAWARGRRLGPVVDEARPVVADGAALVRSTGRLLGRSVDVGAIATELRAHTLADLAVDPGDLDVAAAVTARTGLPIAEVTDALTRPVADDDALVALASDLDRLRSAALVATVTARRSGGDFARPAPDDRSAQDEDHPT